jgi:mannosyltransferase OCH1-like enzyme
MSDIAKNIWTYWHQGFDDAPYVVKKGVEKWKSLHPDWNLYLLDHNNVFDFIDPIPIEKAYWDKLIIPHQSDLIRTQLLIKYGGVWADPTCYPLQSLDSWLPAYMTAGLFFFVYPGPDRIISNWFIGAKKGNFFLQKLYNELCQYWHHDFNNLGTESSAIEKISYRIINRNLTLTRLWFTPLFTKLIKWSPYMVYHYKFYDLTCTDQKCAEIWESMPKFPSVTPHLLQRFGLLAPMDDALKMKIDQKQSPLFKLTWKLSRDNIPKDSALYYLFQSNSRYHST